MKISSLIHIIGAYALLIFTLPSCQSKERQPNNDADKDNDESSAVSRADVMDSAQTAFDIDPGHRTFIFEESESSRDCNEYTTMRISQLHKTTDMSLPDNVKKDLSDIQDEAIKNFAQSDIMLWKLDWNDCLTFYSGGKNRRPFIPHAYTITVDDTLATYDIPKLIHSIHCGDKDAWKAMEKITYSTVTQVCELTPVRVYAYNPVSSDILFTISREIPDSIISMDSHSFMKCVPFAEILLEGYIREATDGNVSMNTLKHDSSARKWLAFKHKSIMGRTHKQGHPNN